MDRVFYRRSLADRYAAYLSARYEVVTPTIVLYEVYKKVSASRRGRRRYRLPDG
ncbi:MAG: hypothetical protein U0231_04510 [Nitrospiraceae bacterium]